VTWLLGAVTPKPSVSDVCCRPADVPEQAWAWSHTEPVLWYAMGFTLVVAGVVLALTRLPRRSRATLRTRTTRA
jgi:hypothetical protein